MLTRSDAQAAVDIDTMLIVDKQKITPTLASLTRLPEQLGKVETILGDAGYFSDSNVTSCEQARIEPYIPPNRDKHNQLLIEGFVDPMLLAEDAGLIDKMRNKL